MQENLNTLSEILSPHCDPALLLLCSDVSTMVWIANIKEYSNFHAPCIFTKYFQNIHNPCMYERSRKFFWENAMFIKTKMLLQKLSLLIAKGKFKSWTGRKNLGLTFFCTQLQIRRNVTLLIPRICHTWSKGDIFKKLLGYLSLWHPVLPAVMKCRKIKQLQCMSDFTWNFSQRSFIFKGFKIPVCTFLLIIDRLN